MSLKAYFETAEGVGILATADSEGNVDAAVYATPHMQDDQTLVLVMADRLSRANLQSNPRAVYLFMESRQGYHGKRLYLEKLREDDDPDRVQSIRRRKRHGVPSDPPAGSHAVTFRVTRVRPLVGDH